MDRDGLKWAPDTEQKTIIDELIQSMCMDDFEGCLCDLPAGHGPDVLHLCAAPGCGTTWTDAQSAAWHERLYREIRDNPTQ